MMLDTLRAKGVNVLDANSGLPIHASGHGHRDELMDLYRAIRPRFAMPVH
jgi:ribonuclease J